MSNILTAVKDDHWKFIRNTLTPTFSSGKMRVVSQGLVDNKVILETICVDLQAHKSISIHDVSV